MASHFQSQTRGSHHGLDVFVPDPGWVLRVDPIVGEQHAWVSPPMEPMPGTRSERQPTYRIRYEPFDGSQYRKVEAALYSKFGHAVSVALVAPGTPRHGDTKHRHGSLRIEFKRVTEDERRALIRVLAAGVTAPEGALLDWIRQETPALVLRTSPRKLRSHVPRMVAVVTHRSRP